MSTGTQYLPRPSYDLQVKYISKIRWHHWLHGGLKGAAKEEYDGTTLTNPQNTANLSISSYEDSEGVLKIPILPYYSTP